MEKEMAASEKETVCEFGIRPEDARPYVVTRSFYLTVRFGPPETMPKGETVWLSKQTADTLFPAGKIEPLEVGRYFKFLHPARIVQNKEWVDLKPGDIVELEREEALRLLRQRLIVEVNPGEVENES